MDAEKLDFPDTTFDAVLCGYAIFFFPNVLQALAEFRRVLKPGGLLAVSTQGTADERWQWWGELLRLTFRIRFEQNLNLSHSGALPPRLTASDQGWFRFKTKVACDPGRPGPPLARRAPLGCGPISRGFIYSRQSSKMGHKGQQSPRIVSRRLKHQRI
jgi:SAM-dependent methyltransferase